MELQDTKVGHIMILKPLEKRIDASVATHFKSRVVDYINAGHRYIVLDLSDVDFIDSSGLGAIVSSFKTIGQNGVFVIADVKEPVMGLFRLTRLDRVFRMFPNRDEAIKALSNSL